MDKTPEYIKMCEKATEIQIDRLMNAGTLFFHAELPQYDYSVIMDSKGDLYVMNRDRQVKIWLPRQDQLIEMKKGMLPEVFFFTMSQFSHAKGNLRKLKERTTEKLTLMYVMGTEHNKLWNGEDWVSA